VDGFDLFLPYICGWLGWRLKVEDFTIQGPAAKKTYRIVTGEDFYSDLLFNLVTTQMPVTYEELKSLQGDAKRALEGS
jgi:hypothetical protein